MRDYISRSRIRSILIKLFWNSNCTDEPREDETYVYTVKKGPNPINDIPAPSPSKVVTLEYKMRNSAET